MTVTHLGALAAFISSVTWAFASQRYSDASRTAGSMRVNLMRALFAALLWNVAWLATSDLSSSADIGVRHTLLLTGSIACSYAVGDGIFFAAAARLGVSTALAIATTYPLWAALYGAMARDEPFGLGRALGMLCCVVGVAALIKLSRDASPGAGKRSAITGVALAMAASLCWAGNAVFLKEGAQGLSLYQANALRFSLGALLLLGMLAVRRPPGAQAEGGLLPLGKRLFAPLIADTGIGSVCYLYGIANTDLALGATLSSLSPLAALPLGLLTKTEHITLARASAVGVTVLGVALLMLLPS